MRRCTLGMLASALMGVAPMAGHAALSAYSQDFERLSAFDANALANDGWLVYGGVYSPDGSTFLYGYGAFPAPNGPFGFSRIGYGPGDLPHGDWQLVVFNDYNNANAHDSGQRVQANVFQLQTIGAEDAGTTWRLRFDARFGNLAAPSTAQAFILTLDPGNGYAVTSQRTLDMTELPSDWGSYSISLPITAGAGEILEFGFASTATNYQASAVIYDNVSFAPIPEPSIQALMLVGLGLLAWLKVNACAQARR